MPSPLPLPSICAAHLRTRVSQTLAVNAAPRAAISAYQESHHPTKRRAVLPELAHRYPGDYRVVHACAPGGCPSGFGAVIAVGYGDSGRLSREPAAHAAGVKGKST